MLTIYVGDAKPDYQVDSYAPEQCLMPKDVAKHFRGWINTGEDQSVRTYTDTIPNLVGEMIDSEQIAHTMVKVVTEYGESTYNSDGVLENWPYGIFCY